MQLLDVHSGKVALKRMVFVASTTKIQHIEHVQENCHCIVLCVYQLEFAEQDLLVPSKGALIIMMVHVYNLYSRHNSLAHMQGDVIKFL